MDRRTFLKSAAVGAVALPGFASAADDADDIPVIDTHVHLWDLKQFKLSWLKPDAPFARNFLIEDYLRATEGCHVVKGIYMEVDVDPTQKQAEANWVRSVCKEGKTPIVAAVIGGNPAAEGFSDYAKQFKGDAYVKGIRQVLHGPTTPKGYCLERPFVNSVRLLGELGLSFDLCMRHPELGDAVKLTKECPDTRFILDHCGNPDVQAKDRSAWQRDLEMLAKNRNVICKISGILSTAKKGEWTPEQLAPIVNHCLNSFGPDRVIFAADWPVCTSAGTFKQWLDTIKVITKERKADERKKLFHDNAVTFYGLQS
jgi:predicted TIM-barrel fold metal-dependent hydrolase